MLSKAIITPSQIEILSLFQKRLSSTKRNILFDFLNKFANLPYFEKKIDFYEDKQNCRLAPAYFPPNNIVKDIY